MKQRFTSLDLQIIAQELRAKLLNFRLQNIYEVSSSSSTFLLKFSVPDEKRMLLIDSGFRVHLTDFARPTTPVPSSFVAKLRKHLKTRRLSDLRQLHTDRVLILTFSDGLYHLVLEFYAGGNVILLDSEHTILAVQRIVTEKASQGKTAVGATYRFDSLAVTRDANLTLEDIARVNPGQISEWIKAEQKQALEVSRGSQGSSGRKARKTRKPYSIGKLLYAHLSYLSNGLIIKHLHEAGMDPNMSVQAVDADSESLDVQHMLQAVGCAVQSLRDINAALEKRALTGYIVARRNEQLAGKPELLEHLPPGMHSEDRFLMFEDFHPFPPYVPPGGVEIIAVEGYNSTADRYFSTVEAMKASMKVLSVEEQAQRRLAAAQADKERRLKALEEAQASSQVKGEAIQENVELVEEVKSYVLRYVNQGMDWTNIEKLVKIEQDRKDRLASLLKLPLDLANSMIKIQLPLPSYYQDTGDDSGDSSSNSGSDSESESESESESDSESNSQSKGKAGRKPAREQQTVNVDIDLRQSAWANAVRYFENKKQAASKQEKTEKQAEYALKSAQQKITTDLKRHLKAETQLKAVRQMYWFEKFYWFVSSDGFLVLGGKDGAQSDILFSRYFKPGDVYVSSDMDGSCSVFVKARPGYGEISPTALMQAGIFSISTSKAWDSKAITSAWWVNYKQVQRASNLKPGEFIITGEKTYLPPSQLVMGFAIGWLVDEETTRKNRAARIEREKQLNIYYEDQEKKEEEKEEKEEKDEKMETSVDSGEVSNPETNPETANVQPEETGADLATNENTEDTETVPSTSEAGDYQEDQEDLKEKAERYGLDSFKAQAATDSVDPADAEELSDALAAKNTATSGTSKKRMSAKERKLAKKGLLGDNNGGDIGGDDDVAGDEVSSVVGEILSEMDSVSISSGNSKASKAGQKKVRGKKGKMKKMAQKYADQDEDERRLRMEALGTLKGAERELENKRRLEEAEKARAELQKRKMEQKKRHEEALLKKQQKLLEETNNDFDEEYVSKLDSISECLKPGDVPLDVVPVFGPWSALQRFKYKVKIQPGTLKKGKAISSCLYMFSNPPKLDKTQTDVYFPWPCEQEILKQVKDTDLLLPVAVSKIKLVVPEALSKAAAKSKNTSSKGGSAGRGKKSKK